MSGIRGEIGDCIYARRLKELGYQIKRPKMCRYRLMLFFCSLLIKRSSYLCSILKKVREFESQTIICWFITFCAPVSWAASSPHLNYHFSNLSFPSLAWCVPQVYLVQAVILLVMTLRSNDLNYVDKVTKKLIMCRYFVCIFASHTCFICSTKHQNFSLSIMPS